MNRGTRFGSISALASIASIACVTIIGIVGTGNASPELTDRLRKGDAARAKSAIEKLEEAFAKPDTAKWDKRSIQGIRQNIKKLRRIVNRYFSAPNLRKDDIRPTVLALRTVIRDAMSGSDPLLRINQDVIVIRPQVHYSIAVQCAHVGWTKCQLEELKAASRSAVDQPALLAEIRQTLHTAEITRHKSSDSSVNQH